MSQRSVNLQGAIDLSSLAAPPQTAAEAAATDSPAVIDVTMQTFQELVQRSSQVPVVIDLRSTRSPSSVELSALLAKMAKEYGGRFLLARVDADANPQIVQAFQVQGVPTVVAVLNGQPFPLFQGSAPQEQIRAVLDEVLKVAAENGVTGKVEGMDDEAQEVEEEVVEEPLPPHIQAAYDALENDDLDGAADAFREALKENPSDGEAKAGLAQVELGQRLNDVDTDALRPTLEDPNVGDLDAKLQAADVEAASGQFEQAYTRLINVIRVTFGDDRETVRKRLLELFLLVPEDTPELLKARRDLATALF